MKHDGCPSGYKIKDGKCIPKNWRELKEGETFHGIHNYKGSHWGKGQTGILLCEDGNYEISDNKPTYKEKEGYLKPEGMEDENSQRSFPTHRSFKNITKKGCWGAIYSFAYASDCPGGTIWLYPGISEYKLKKLKKAFCNIKDKYGTGDKTRVLFNATDKVLFRLGDIC